MSRKTPPNNNVTVSGPPEEVGQMIGDMIKYIGAKPVMTDEECIEKIKGYFEECAAKSRRPLWEELCLALGVNRSTMMRWEKKEMLANTNRSEIVKQAREIMAAFDARAVSEGKLNPIVYIFRSKNFYGLRDQQEHILTPNQPMGEVQSVELIEQAIENDLIE